MLSFYGEQKGLRVARKHLAGYVESLASEDIEARRRSICQTTSPEQVLAQLGTLRADVPSGLAA